MQCLSKRDREERERKREREILKDKKIVLKE
jgi:hypothetical protein